VVLLLTPFQTEAFEITRVQETPPLERGPKIYQRGQKLISWAGEKKEIYSAPQNYQDFSDFNIFICFLLHTVVKGSQSKTGSEPLFQKICFLDVKNLQTSLY